ncbi:S100P-binding protein isoform X2 [Microcaecilia unicolor]|uniref:S100P-binding protein n=1 Tax=Microcaecilia unicolor TaxID=1415580 RepID=A0A6P7ZJA0_9AMPH|nr:S100P-binding protein-like isoform X2 [Microcaecilia unicolor]
MENEIQNKLRGQRRMGCAIDSGQCHDGKNCCDREVVCSFPEHNPCGSPNNIKIRIFKERAPETKRQLDESLEEDQSLRGAFKKPRLMYPNCSTPIPVLKEAFPSPDSAYFPGSSSCFDETQPRRLVARISVSLPDDPLAFSSPASKQDQNELDDSLLEASDDDADSPLYLTEEQMQKLLEDDWSATGVEREPLHDAYSSPEESEEFKCYNSQLCTRVVVEGAPLSQSTSSSAPSSLLTLDVTRSMSLEQNHLECKEINNIPFDCDIDEILALSPIDRSFIEQEREDCVVVEENTELQDGHFRGATDLPEKLSATKQEPMPLSNPQIVEDEPGEYAAEPECAVELVEHPLCGEECTAAPGEQALCSHSLLNPPTDKELGRSQDGTTLEEVANEVHSFKSINMPAKESPETAAESVSFAQNASLQKPQPLKKDNIKEVTLTKDDRGENLQGKKPGKAALSKPEERQVRIPPAELERRKHSYVQCVLKHRKLRKETDQDAYRECLALMDKVARTGWQHPLNLTLRSYPRFSKKLPNKWSLKQWVSRNGAYGRFEKLGNIFQRSSVVALPS